MKGGERWEKEILTLEYLDIEVLEDNPIISLYPLRLVGRRPILMWRLISVLNKLGCVDNGATDLASSNLAPCIITCVSHS
jgi:hypothetical protein